VESHLTGATHAEPSPDNTGAPSTKSFWEAVKAAQSFDDLLNRLKENTGIDRSTRQR
jgi:hypothetical protein